MDNEKLGFRRGVYIVLAVIVAVIIWFFADQISGPNGTPTTCSREISDIPIEYINARGLEERGLMLVEEGSDDSLDLTLEGTRWLIANLDRSDIRVTVDLSNVERAGQQSITYVITYADRRFSALNRTGVSIPSASVQISELFSKTVEVRCELIGNVAEGYSAGQVQLSQSTLEVQGQEEDIGKVAYAKVIFDIGENAEESVTESLPIRFYDKNNQPLENISVHTNVESVQATLPVFVTKELWLTMDFVESAGLRRRNVKCVIRPEAISVSGDASRLRRINSIVLDQLDLTSLLSGSSTHHYPITVPEGCQNLSGVTRATVEVSLENIVQKTLYCTNFLCENMPEGKTVEVLTEGVGVKLYGAAEDVESLSEDQIVLVADLSDFSAALGTYTVSVRAENRSGKDIGISGSYEMQITLREAGEEVTPEE